MNGPRYVAFPSLHTQPLLIGARLCVPDGPGPRPAVVILHGREGPTVREAAYANALAGAGFITLEPDHRSARGASPPPSVHETLPDLFGARRFLAARDDVDASRIGVLGFASGGAAALLAATVAVDMAFPADGGFGGFVAFYPVCHRFNRVLGFELAGLVAAPVLIATASLDEYDDDPAAGPALARSMPALDRLKVRTAVFYSQHHAFDLPGPDRHTEDPDAHSGRGGAVTEVYDPEAASRAHGLAVQVFSEMQGRPTKRRRSASWEAL